MVACQGEGTVAFLGPGSRTVIREVLLKGRPQDLIVDVELSRIYVIEPSSQRLVVLDLAGARVAGAGIRMMILTSRQPQT